MGLIDQNGYAYLCGQLWLDIGPDQLRLRTIDVSEM